MEGFQPAATPTRRGERLEDEIEEEGEAERQGVVAVGRRTGDWGGARDAIGEDRASRLAVRWLGFHL
jgi:hypothetical protein